MVEARCVRDKETNADQWLTEYDWLRLRVTVYYSIIRIVHSSKGPS